MSTRWVVGLLVVLGMLSMAVWYRLQPPAHAAVVENTEDAERAAARAASRRAAHARSRPVAR
jgi:hypothetical protein